MKSQTLKTGQTTETGHVVKKVLGQSPLVAVYISEDRQLRWVSFGNGGDLSASQKVAIGKFDGLMTNIKTYVPKQHRIEQLTLLGKALFRALVSENEPTDDDSFDEVVNAVEELAGQQVRFTYVICCLISFATILIALLSLRLLFGLAPIWNVVSLAGIAGAAGACLSVLHRVRKLDIDWKAPTKMVAIESIARIAVGLFFGMLFSLMCLGDLVLGALKENSLALLVFATIAGFSERFIPELMGKLEARATESAQG